MASTSAGQASHPVLFTTQTQYPLPSQKFMIPSSWKRYQLSQLVNKALSLPKPVPFDFLVQGEILRGTLGEWCAGKGLGEEETLEIEYFESVMPPQKMTSLPHEDWISSVSCQLSGHIFTASYDGHIRAFDYSKELLYDVPVHNAPATSVCVVPRTNESGSSSKLIVSSSHDLTARMTTFPLSPSSGEPQAPRILASLHLHTSPLSSISASASGTHLLTASWDGLIGVWDTTVPDMDEVPLADITTGADRKKRRKVDTEEAPKRKAPTVVLKSHTARVSKAVFSGVGNSAVSCGTDSTVRVWDIENGLCTNTITAPSRPFLDLAVMPSGNSAIATSTDRTASQYDLRIASSTSIASVSTLVHPAMPSCVAVPPTTSENTSEYQVLTGAYDGVVRLWDLRSVKSAVTSFKVWEGKDAGKKVLSVDWTSGIVGVGGEGGVEVWRLGQGRDLLSMS